MKKVVAGIEYTKPKVYLLNANGLGIAELASRTAYNSFGKSENETIREFDCTPESIKKLKDITSSDLVNQLANVYHHDSVLEHIILQYAIKGISRGVLQELVRHRIASYTVQSTRYTMSSVINAFIASNGNPTWFNEAIEEMDMFVISNDNATFIEMQAMYSKLRHQQYQSGNDKFLQISLSNDNLEYILNEGELDNYETRFKTLESNKQKKNVGDNFKWIVTDNWKTDLVMTINLRSLINFLKLRNKGSAYFQIKWLAEEIINATPKQYLDLI